VSFLLWLLYVHHASSDFAGPLDVFCQAPQRASQRIMCDFALCVGLYFIKHQQPGKRTARACCWPLSRSHPFFLVSYIVNHALHGDTIFPRPRPGAHALPFHF